MDDKINVSCVVKAEAFDPDDFRYQNISKGKEFTLTGVSSEDFRMQVFKQAYEDMLSVLEEGLKKGYECGDFEISIHYRRGGS
jgi:hypothetical protein